MKRLPSLAVALGLTQCLFLTALHAQSLLLKDDFNTYTASPLAASSAWGSTIPGSTGSWATNTGGPQAIVNGSVAGRTGQLYQYSENAASQTSTYSSTQLSSAYSGAETWELSVDFYVADFANTPTALTLPSVFTIIGLFNEGSLAAANRLTTVSLSRNSSTGLIQMSATREGGSTFFTNSLDTQTWYTLTVTGNFSTQLMDISITGTGHQESLSNLAFVPTAFDTIALGDTTANAWAAGRSNSVYLDNVSLATIPEPASVALLFCGGLGLLLHKRLRKTTPPLS